MAMFWITIGFGQEEWDLERCIRYANENSITLKQADINTENAKLTQTQNKMAQLPNLDFQSNYSFSFGRSIDPTTNEFRSQNLQSQSYSIQGGAFLYRGLTIRNGIKAGALDIEAAEADKEAAVNDLGLNVAAAYLGVLQAQDQIAIAENRKKQTEDQLDRTNKLIEAGTLPEANRYDLEAQLASDDQTLTAANNGLILAYLSLKQLLNLDPAAEMSIVRPDILLPVEGNLDDYVMQELFSTALTTQPMIYANEKRIESAEIGVKITKGALHPSLSVFGDIGTRYSSISRDFENFNVTGEFDRTDLIVEAGGQQGILTVLDPVVEFGKRPYFKQLNDNFNQGISLGLAFPIYNRHTNRVAIQKAQLQVLSAQYSDELARTQLKADIQRALTDAKAAYDQLEASEKTVTARQKSFENAEKRYSLGAINTFEYNLAKDNFDVARSNEVFAKYDYVFKMKVLDFYLGRPIKLD